MAIRNHVWGTGYFRYKLLQTYIIGVVVERMRPVGMPNSLCAVTGHVYGGFDMTALQIEFKQTNMVSRKGPG